MNIFVDSAEDSTTKFEIRSSYPTVTLTSVFNNISVIGMVIQRSSNLEVGTESLKNNRSHKKCDYENIDGWNARITPKYLYARGVNCSRLLREVPGEHGRLLFDGHAGEGDGLFVGDEACARRGAHARLDVHRRCPHLVRWRSVTNNSIQIQHTLFPKIHVFVT